MIATQSRTQVIARQFFSFCLVGGSGVIVNSALLYLLHDRMGLELIVASILATEVAIINNFFWNNRFTFHKPNVRLWRLLRFNLVSLGGLLITTGILTYLTNNYGIYFLLANLVAIGVATFWNFFANFAWTWGRKASGK